MKTLFPTLVMLLLLIPAPQGFSEPLTRQEIASELGSKTSFTKAEVVEILYGAGVIFDEELERAKAEAKALWEAKMKELTDAFALDLAEERQRTAAAVAERDTWRLVGIGLGAAGLTGVAFGALHK